MTSRGSLNGLSRLGVMFRLHGCPIWTHCTPNMNVVESCYILCGVYLSEAAVARRTLTPYSPAGRVSKHKH